MQTAPAVTILATAIAVAAIAIYLIVIGVILKRVSGTLNVILGAVSAVSEKTASAGDVIGAINRDLAAGHSALDGAVGRLKERTSDLEGDSGYGRSRESQRRSELGVGPEA